MGTGADCAHRLRHTGAVFGREASGLRPAGGFSGYTLLCRRLVVVALAALSPTLLLSLPQLPSCLRPPHFLRLRHGTRRRGTLCLDRHMASVDTDVVVSLLPIQ